MLKLKIQQLKTAYKKTISIRETGDVFIPDELIEYPGMPHLLSDIKFHYAINATSDNIPDPSIYLIVDKNGSTALLSTPKLQAYQEYINIYCFMKQHGIDFPAEVNFQILKNRNKIVLKLFTSLKEKSSGEQEPIFETIASSDKLLKSLATLSPKKNIKKIPSSDQLLSDNKLSSAEQKPTLIRGARSAAKAIMKKKIDNKTVKKIPPPTESTFVSKNNALRKPYTKKNKKNQITKNSGTASSNNRTK